MDVVDHGHSMPVGGPLYPPSPHYYQGPRIMIAMYEADTAAVAAQLPDGVTPLHDPVVCTAWGADFPQTTYGPYRESFLFVQVDLDVRGYNYNPFIYVTNDAAMAAGRETWGFPKEFADIRVDTSQHQMITTTDRPAGRRIMTLTTTPERPADPAELGALPVLTLRKIPASRPDAPPTACELIRIDTDFIPHRTATDQPDLWSGRASLTMDSRSAIDPLQAFAPTRILGGYFGTFDMVLPIGTPVHDYLT
ncbi:hypothetical protein CDO52_13525 [Nocardiopsis gilva YIM 90087]|uniref:Acetoacetate decarboxylase n=1 Tax=Nocardiopsis gilva YIM 90087 TaxID=1235441 RepID=A0A223S6C5_9ACTN|nr:acetoacetate decarboxylase family protein [Nocardiopsis gilva]ASU83675.1 hypothetical protein CDO52_13525 [Nocardiopsis gilva YIM 90087]